MKTLRALVLANLVIAVVQAPAAIAQTGTISGTVVNAATHEPMEGVLVSIAGAPVTAVTSSDGAFALLFVAPGVYTVSARRGGFATHEFTNVDVQAGRTRVLNFALRTSASDTTERTAFAAPFVDPKLGGTAIRLTSDDIISLPTLTMSSALGVSGGYLELPSATATLSLSDIHRGITRLPSVRAGRPEATEYLIDGISVNNPVFGAPPILIEPFSAASVTFLPAHVDAEHGNALSGLVDQAIRTGTARPSGAVEYQTSALAGALGSAASGATGTYAARGYLAGPFPFVGDKLKYSLAGHVMGERANVRKIANDDWHGSGGDDNSQVVAKVSYAVRPTITWSVSAVGQRRTTVGIDPDYLEGDSVAPATVRDISRLLITSINKRFSRANISVSFADTHASRETCSIWQGVCVTDHFMRNPVGNEIPAFGPPPQDTPYRITGQYFGGESYDSRVVRADVAAQVTDHHQIAAGIYATHHDISYHDAIGSRWLQGRIITTYDTYRAKPVEFSSYAQDAIEFDLITVHIGGRFDYGNTGGVAFVNPLNPTNGTTAYEVCEGTAPGINTTAFTYGNFRGIAACLNAPSPASGRSVLLDSATRLAQTDDFRPVRPRVAFSPRIGLAFPLTEQSGIFFNIGRYNRNPLYHDAYRNSGTGSRAGPAPNGDGMCDLKYERLGTAECNPAVAIDFALPEFVGNPDLAFETADAWEAGFNMVAGRTRSIEASVFSNSQSHLPSVYTAVLPPDIGLTYGVIAQHPMRAVISGGSSSSLGASITLRSNSTGPLSYTINYTYQRSTEIGARPDLVAEAIAAKEVYAETEERISASNRPHTFNAQFSWQWRQETPKALGPVTSAILRNSRTVVTVFAASASQAPTTSQATCTPTLGQPCAALGGGVPGTGTLVNLLYVRTLAARSARWALIGRVLNLLNEDNGASDLTSLDERRRSAELGRTAQPLRQASFMRRVIAGMSFTF